MATGQHDHSFTLQAIMELQKSSAEVSTRVEALKSSVDGLKAKVDDLVAWKYKILGGVAVAGICIGLAVSAAVWLSNYVTLKPQYSIPAPATAKP